MPPRGKRFTLERWLAERRPAQIGEAEFGEILRLLAPVSESYARRLVRESGAPLHPLVEGVRQGSLDELEESLRKLLDEYQRGDVSQKSAVRRLVITAKDHARLASRNPAKRVEKEEMLLWLITWLENPPLFADWVRLRRGLLRE